MSRLPPTFADTLFDDLDNPNEAQVQAIFTPIIRQLHSFLNDLPCLCDLQQFRGQRLSIQPRFSVAFGNCKIYIGEWYTYHHGGSTEMQFNVGMYGAPLYHIRVGMGFCFYGPGRPVVDVVFSRFVALITQQSSDFTRFANAAHLEIERQSRSDDRARIEPVTWLFSQSQPQEWLSVGRLLRRQEHRAILSDARRLAEVMEGVFSGFRRFYDQIL
jgi:hypothetical protein